MLYNFLFVQHNTTINLFINVRNLARKDVYANEHDKKNNKLPTLILSFRSQH